MQDRDAARANPPSPLFCFNVPRASDFSNSQKFETAQRDSNRSEKFELPSRRARGATRRSRAQSGDPGFGTSLCYRESPLDQVDTTKPPSTERVVDAIMKPRYVIASVRCNQ